MATTTTTADLRTTSTMEETTSRCSSREDLDKAIIKVDSRATTTEEEPLRTTGKTSRFNNQLLLFKPFPSRLSPQAWKEAPRHLFSALIP